MGEYSDLFDDGSDRVKAKANLRFNLDANPDQVARERNLAARYDLPPAVVAQYRPDYEAQARVDDVAPVIDASPKLRSWLAADDSNARIAHDDVENMGLTETLVNSFKRGVLSLKSLSPTLQVVNQASGVNLYKQIDARIAAGEDPKAVLSQYGDYGLAPLPWTTSAEALASYQQTRDRANPIMQERLGSAAVDLSIYQREHNAIPLPGVIGRTMAADTFGGALSEIGKHPLDFMAGIGPESLVQSIPGMLAAIPAGVATGPVGAAATIGGNSALTDFASTIVEGMQSAGIDTTDPEAVRAAMQNPDTLAKITDMAAKHASVVGAFDAISGGIAGKMVLPARVAGKLAARPLAQEIANIALQVPIQAGLGAAGEFGGELAAGQTISPGNILAEAFGEMFGTPGEVIAASGKRIIEKVHEARRAEENTANLERLDKVAEASKVRARDPATFEAFVNQAAEDGPVQDVFIDANTLMQTGMADQLAAVSPSVASQLRDALQTGGDIRIPVGEYAAHVAGTELSQSLMDHLKTEPGGMSRAEAQEFMQSHADDLKAEVARTMAEKQGDETFKQSIESVKADVKAKLDSVSRFTGDVNDSYATLVANFYGVTAAKLGITPQELFAQYPLNIGAQSAASGQVLSQVETLDAVKQQWADAGISSSVSERDNTITLSKIVVPESNRREGKGTVAMQALTDYADRTGQRIVLSPSSDFGGNKNQLIKFYKKFGFVENKGKAKDFTTMESMYRPARELNQTKNGARGSFNPATNTINLFKSADLSTFLHEAGHFFLETQFDIAARLGKGSFGSDVLPNAREEDTSNAFFISSKSAAQAGNIEQFKLETEVKNGVSRVSNVYVAPELRSKGVAKAMYKRAISAALARGLKFESDKSVSENALRVYKSLEKEGYVFKYHLDGAVKTEVPDTLDGSRIQFVGKTPLVELVSAPPEAAAPLTESEKQLVADSNALLKWFGVNSIQEWNSLDFEEKRSYHEQFARGFEAYLFEGKAPSIELQGLFQRFRAWLVNVYRDVRNLNVELNDQVRQVMDRMLASTDEIKLAEAAREMMPLFESAEKAGVTPQEFAAYHELGVDATNAAIEDVQARSLRDLAWTRNARGREIKKLQKEAEALRHDVQMDARREVMSQPVYRAWQFLTGKEDKNTATGEQLTGKLNTNVLSEMGLHADTVALLKARKMTKADGIHPDVVAEMFGFSSGDELVQELAAANPPSDEIEGLTDARMLEQHGELATPQAIERAADIAIHNEARARFVTTEANLLAKATGRPKILASAAKEYARVMIARLKVRDIRPGQYAAAEVRASKASQKASQAGDLTNAAIHKRNQVLNTYLTKSAYDAQDEVAKGVRYLKKFESEGTRKNLDVDYLDQIDALTERFDLRTGQSLKAIDQRTSLANWITAQRDQGLEPDIDPQLENEAFRKSYKDMTVEEFRGVIDAVKQIEHLGRLKHKLLTAADQRAYEAVRDEIASSIINNAGDRTANTRTPTTNAGRALQTLKNFYASHIKAATLARVMDGGKDGGPVWEYFIRNANERGDMETTMRAEATIELSRIMAPVFKLGKMGGKGQFFPGIGRSLNRESRIAIALNVGNAGNLQRLLGGEGWTLAQLAPVLQSLTAAEWQAVQQIWDHFESYRPQIAAKERRVYGKEPDWVEPTPFTMQTADGQSIDLKGGYYPIKYDPSASQRAEEHADAEGAKRQLQGAYTSATTRRSFTKSRTDEVNGRPLLYTLAGMYSGVNDVIHDLAWHEWLIDTNKLLRSKTIDSAIRNHYGPEVKAQFKSWSQDIAEGEQGAANAGEVALGRLRQGVSIAGLGFNVVSAIMQPLGITQSIVRVGAPWIGRGVSRYISNPRAAAREVNEKSSFMMNRSRTRFRELNELRNKVQDETAIESALKTGAYFLMMRCQQMVDVPTWIGAYEKAISEGNDESRATALADQAVIDAQGGGQTKDLAAIERGGPALKLFTVFYSFMNTAFNLGIVQTMSPQKRARLAVDYLLLFVVPPALGYVLKQAVTPGDDDFDDPEKLAKGLASQQIDYLMGLMVVVREFSAAARIMSGAEEKGRDYTGPAGLRLIYDVSTLGKQANQGEFDDAFRKAAINVVGDLFGLPAAQINRTITGAQAISEDKTANPAALIFGFKEKR